ncbi:hypothetical protein FB382_000014 [Nocardioides ginsengisegetis]|uniref:Polyketide cyclase / dehydrase and lipid transport n=1 Tax=Nocardioides ginsengisegetis TaxID=661491 RepID=A0A7W3IW71_9ACTN|nr:hypothetical protein [Nocardioides ginsengisegetis]
MDVAFPVSSEAAFDYLVDPVHRPEWQSSLRRVEDVDGEPRVGQTWTDVTVPGLRPAMETTVLERPRRWSERGTWRGVTATLTLTFADAPGGCTVHADFAVTGRGPLGPALRLLTVASRPAVRADLRRAAAILAKG